MQKTLEGLKDAIKALESGKAAAQPNQDGLTLADLRSELRVLATSLNECAQPSLFLALSTRKYPPIITIPHGASCHVQASVKVDRVVCKT
jgi:hypothetical protein